MADDVGGARPAIDANAIMLGGMNLYGMAEGQRGADGVGATNALAPGHAGQQMNVFGKAQGMAVALHGENQRTGVGERHDGPRLRQKIPCARHDGGSGFKQFTVLVFKRLQLRFADRRRAATFCRINLAGPAALPRTFDQTAQGIRCWTAPCQKSLPCRHDRRIVPGIGKDLSLGFVLHLLPLLLGDCKRCIVIIVKGDCCPFDCSAAVASVYSAFSVPRQCKNGSCFHQWQPFERPKTGRWIADTPLPRKPTHRFG